MRKLRIPERSCRLEYRDYMTRFFDFDLWYKATILISSSPAVGNCTAQALASMLTFGRNVRTIEREVNAGPPSPDAAVVVQRRNA